MRFDVTHADPLAVRLALASCRLPLRLERSRAGVAIIVAKSDAAATSARWLRAGVEAHAAPPWPDARALGRGVLEVAGTRRRIARVPVDAPAAGAELVLALEPVPAPDALRALARAMRAPIALPLRRRRPRPLARVAAAILSGDDGVAAARAFAIVPDGVPALAGSVRLRRGALAAWRAIDSPHGGVWRSLAALETWWRPR
jgi:hypothetical protein